MVSNSFFSKGGGLRSGWGGGRNTGWFHHDNRIEQAGAELCQAQQCLSCQLAWVAYLVVNQLWLELVAWSSSRLESTGWRTVTKCKISLGSATFIQSRLLSHVTHFSFLSNKRFSSKGGGGKNACATYFGHISSMEAWIFMKFET